MLQAAKQSFGALQQFEYEKDYYIQQQKEQIEMIAQVRYLINVLKHSTIRNYCWEIC